MTDRQEQGAQTLELLRESGDIVRRLVIESEPTDESLAGIRQAVTTFVDTVDTMTFQALLQLRREASAQPRSLSRSLWVASVCLLLLPVLGFGAGLVVGLLL